MAIRLTYDFVKKEFYKEGYKLISKEYKNCMLKLETICSNGHEYLVSWNTFQQGHRCKKCHIQSNSEKFSHSYEFVKKQIEKEGYKLISNNYKNNKIKIKIECPFNHEYYIRYDNFEQGQRCKKCANIKLSKEKTFNYEYIKNEFEKEGYELISKKYINANIKLETICPNGHEYTVRYSNFKDGVRCKTCHVLNNTGENSYLWKGGVVQDNIPLYDTYAHKINYAEEVRRDPEDKNILQVKCKYCNIWHTPKMKDVVNRINVLEGKQTGGYNFYCSPECKQLCPIFGKKESTYLKENSLYYEEKDNYRPYQQEWSQMVKEKANNKCEICGSKENLVGHHIQPVKPCPHLQADIDNGVCLCQDCHYTHGHKDKCSTGNLARMIQ